MATVVMRNLVCALALLGPGAALALQSGDPPSGEDLFGVWSNPSGSVHVRIAPCEEQLCGTVVYASDKAKSDAARAGTPELVGVNLFRKFEPRDNGSWRGKVLVPDLKRTVSGTLTRVDVSTLDVQGCVFGHIACKDQRWSRVSD